MTQVTEILTAIDRGDAQAAEQLLPLVYDELRHLASQKLAHEKPGQTLQATALVHEAYLRLVGPKDQNWNSRGHFFAAAAEAMRRILVENARKKHRLKRGQEYRRVHVDNIDMTADQRAEDILALDEALDALSNHDKTAADLVKLRYLAGLTIDQTAAVLGISPRTANRVWAYARAWLQVRLSDSE